MGKQAMGVNLRHTLIHSESDSQDVLVVGPVDEEGGVYLAVQWGWQADNKRLSVVLGDAGRKELIRLLGGTA